MRSKTLYFVAGEASGDEHGAALMRALRESQPDLQFIGRGGPRMQAIAGKDFTDWITIAGVLGLWEVVKHYGYFHAQFLETLTEVATGHPDAVILIDYPGFNLRLARALRRRSRTQKIIYYISPQVWAWHRGRIRQMARSLDLMLCIFPFEAELYNRSGLRTIFVGHPMIENLGAQRIETTRDPNLIGFFPGSRVREIRKIFPVMLGAASEIAQRLPNVRFEVAAASEALASEITKLLSKSSLPASKLQVTTGQTPAIMQRACAGLIASGTATLEAAYFRLPFVLVYKVAWLTYFAARIVVRVRFLGMPNVLANRQIVPEFIQHAARPRPIADVVLSLMNDSSPRQRMISEFDAVVNRLGESGANREAARAILREVGAES
jgi:lipid-A-disaccharide synthase